MQLESGQLFKYTIYMYGSTAAIQKDSEENNHNCKSRKQEIENRRNAKHKPVLSLMNQYFHELQQV